MRNNSDKMIKQAIENLRKAEKYEAEEWEVLIKAGEPGDAHGRCKRLSRVIQTLEAELEI